eukprot:1716460-Rhodomonas_salina.1
MGWWYVVSSSELDYGATRVREDFDVFGSDFRVDFGHDGLGDAARAPPLQQRCSAVPDHALFLALHGVSTLSLKEWSVLFSFSFLTWTWVQTFPGVWVYVQRDGG